MDFETPGIMADPDTWENGILGIMVESRGVLTYRCVILDDSLEKIARIFPQHCIFSPELDFGRVLADLSKIEGLKDCEYVFSWSNVDIQMFDHFFGHHWDGRTVTDNGRASFLGDSGIMCWNALPDCRRLGRELYKTRKPHQLKKYMDLLGIEHPPGSVASNSIRELKMCWQMDNSGISEREESLSHQLLQYNYYDCFGLRGVMSTLHSEAGAGENFPNLDILAHPDFRLSKHI